MEGAKLDKVRDMAKQAAKKARDEHTLVVIRHGATKLNKESDERIRGHKDVPLSSEGVKQAHIAGRKLKKAGIDGIISSDLSRAADTAKIVSKHTGAPLIKVTRGLRPWHMGAMTGQEVKKILPVMQDFIKNHPDVKVPEGESFNTFKRRFLKEIMAIRAKYPKHKIAVVTHHRGERLLDGWMADGQPKDPGKIGAEHFMVKGIKPGTYKDYEVTTKKEGKI